jgi:hypothetical protein
MTPLTSFSRRGFLTQTAALLGAPAFAQRKPQRKVVLMIDGFGVEYLEQSSMPTLAKWRQSGLYRRVQDVMPAVTNTNTLLFVAGSGLRGTVLRATHTSTNAPAARNTWRARTS